MAIENRGRKTGGVNLPTASVGRPTKLPEGRWLDDLRPLKWAEQQLIEKAAAGKPCRLGKKRPEAATVGNRIRAKLIRFLILGGDDGHPVHELGIWLEGAWIDGDLDLECVQSTVFVALLQCRVSGLLRAVDADLPGLNLEGTLLHGLDAARLNVEGSLFLRRVLARAEVRLDGAKIGGNFDCDGGQFCDAPIPSDYAVGSRGDFQQLPAAMRAPGIWIKGDALMGKNALGEEFSAQGEVRLTSAKIDGDLTCSGGNFSTLERRKAGNGEEVPAALKVDGSTIKGNIFLNKGFSAAGGVLLTGASIDGNLTCTAGIFSVDNRINNGDCGAGVPGALEAERITVKGDVFFDAGFSADGEVRLSGAQIEGSLHCSGGKFIAGDDLNARRIALDAQKIAFDAQRMTVNGKFELRGATFLGRLNLTASRVGSLVDDSSCWKTATLHIDGFHYDRISESSTGAEDRIRWLERQRSVDLTREFKPQPWEQLIKTLRDMGHPDEATEIAIEKRERMGASGQMEGFRWFIHKMYGWFALYGYRPTRTLTWVLGVMIYLAMIYAIGEQQGLFGPVAPAIQLSPATEKCVGGGEPGTIRWTSPKCPLPPEYSTFQPLLYSADLILPFVDLQQEKDWAPITQPGPSRWLLNGHVLRAFMWFEIIFGWLMSLLLLAALGRVLNRD